MEGKKIENIVPDSMPELERQNKEEVKEIEKKEIVLTEQQQQTLFYIEKWSLKPRFSDEKEIEKLNREIDEIFSWCNNLSLPIEVIQPILEQKIKSLIISKCFSSSKKLAAKFNFPDEITHNIALDAFSDILTANDIYDRKPYYDLRTEFSLSNEEIISKIKEKIIKISQKTAIKYPQSSGAISSSIDRDMFRMFDLAYEAATELDISVETIINDSNIKEAAKKEIDKYFSDPDSFHINVHGIINFEGINRFIERFNIPFEETNITLLDALNKLIIDDGIDLAIKIMYEYKVGPESKNLPLPAKEKVLKWAFEKLTEGEIDEIIQIDTDFNIWTDDEIYNIAEKVYIECLKTNNYNICDEIGDRFYLYDKLVSSSEATGVAAETIKYLLGKNSHLIEKYSIERAVQITENFNFTGEIFIDFLKQYLKERRWISVILIGNRIPACKSLYNDFLNEQKNIANDSESPFGKRQKAFDALAGLAENGESSITEEFAEILKSRSKQKEIPESKWGLDPIQEAAFYTLLRLDNPNSNEALFGMLFNENVNDTVKHAVFRKLKRHNRQFLDEKVRIDFYHWYRENNTDWNDLRFINAIIKDIPSTETRNKSLFHSNIHGVIINLLELEDEKNKSLYEIWQEKYNNIPENSFLQIVNFSLPVYSYDESIYPPKELVKFRSLMNKFQTLYTAIKKENTKKENLLHAVVNCLEINFSTKCLLTEKLSEIDFKTKEDADNLSNLFRRVLFINSIEKISAHRNYEDDEYYEEEYPDDEDGHDKNKDSEIDREITDIFSRKITNLAELENLLKEVATKNIQKVLPNSEITVEKIEVVLDKWQGDLEPIFTYLSRFPHLKQYVAEIVAHIDTEENWQKWRYNLKNKTVKQQIGHLSESQLKVWQENHLAELGDIMVAQSEVNKPRHIRALLRDSIMQHKHIYNPEMGQNKNEFIQKTIENAYNQISKNPEQDSQIIDKETSAIVGDIKQIDVIIKQSNIAKLRQILEKNFSENKEIKFNAETKNSLNFIISFLSKEMSAGVLEYYRKNEEEKQKITADGILTQEIREALEKNILDTEEKAKKIIESSEIWEKFSLDKTNLKNLGPVYQKRQELKAIVDLLRLSNLSNKLIATNRISEKEGKKEAGETISTVLENLKKYFKDSPLLQDLQNVEFSLKEKQEFGEKRRLAMVFTDNPQILWQVGKYPLGCGSCQNYAEGSHASHLMGYVGDANCKAVYLVDLNKLPKDTKDKLDQNGFEQIKDNLTASELLNISLARSIVKMTKDKDNKPVILLEPTYSSINKGDFTMDKYFNLFIDLMVAESMQAKMARGNGNESVSKGASRSPGGQYEDLDLSSVGFIHKLSKPTKEEEEIMEIIRSSR